MKNSSHQPEKLDALRAGLHVEDVDFQDAAIPMLIDRENAHWQRVVSALEDDAHHDRATSNQLRIRRRQVLNGEYSRHGPWGLPQAAAGAAAGVALALGVAVWWEPAPNPTAAGTQTASIDSMEIENAEFTNNIDFYTWLEQQPEAVADSGGS